MAERIFNSVFVFFMFLAGVFVFATIGELVYSSANIVDVEGVLVFKEEVRTNRGLLVSPSYFNLTIRDKAGRTYIARSEDSQLSGTKQYSCVLARLYPYPPWRKRKEDLLYRDAAILSVSNCKGKNK